MFTDAEHAADPVRTIMRFRCHALADIMTDAKAKGEVLSVGAKTAITKLVKEELFGVRGTIQSKYIKKGLECEQTSIDLLNEVTGGAFFKNEVRLMNEFITGEPDIVAKSYGVDIKTSWSIETFPLTPVDGEDKTYEWQARGYMMLFDKPRWDIAYCLVDTPDHLIGYDDPRIHKVSHIDPRMRVTLTSYFRDIELEEKIRTKCAAAQAYYAELIRSIKQNRGVEKVFVAEPAPLKTTAATAFAGAAFA